MNIHAGHIACIVGGGVAGSEAAMRLARRGIYSVVFDMGALPYGKIELGLPKWHWKQRDLEEERIDANLNNPYIRYVPCTKLGVDISLDEILQWNFSVILLAAGAWRDRPLSIAGIEQYGGRGFYYQNPFVAWFNQYHANDYDGPRSEICDDAIVIGGGLASIDVVKILMLETTQRALQAKGLAVDLFTLEKKGIPKVLESLEVPWKDLGLRGCTLYYRRRAIDMPLVPAEEEPDAERVEQLKKVRQKVLANAQNKYLFRFVPCRLPFDVIVEKDRLRGLVFHETEVTEEGVIVLHDTRYEVRTPLVISSIGSVPEHIPGISTSRELYEIENMETGKLAGFPSLFALGNAVTGRGNIRASRLHAGKVTEFVMDNFFNWKAEDHEQLVQLSGHDLEISASRFMDWIKTKNLRSPQEIRKVFERTADYQKRVGYEGDYLSWIIRHRPVRLESLLNK